MFSIDGTVWNVPCQIEREAQMQASEISGMLLDRTYFNDVLGTYMSYTVSIAVPFDRLSLYRAIYDKLTNPLEAHIFVLPFDDATITLTGRVERVNDSWVRMPGDKHYWRNITFTVTAIHPSRYYSLREAISRGRPVVPTIDGERPAVLEPLHATRNGRYAPDRGVDGFDSVTVAVPVDAPDERRPVIYENGWQNYSLIAKKQSDNAGIGFADDQIVLTTTSASNTGICISPIEPMDLTQYRYAFLRCTLTGVGRDPYPSWLCARTDWFPAIGDAGDQAVAHAALSTSASEQTVRLDISSLSGLGFVYLAGYNFVGSVTKLWVE